MQKGIRITSTFTCGLSDPNRSDFESQIASDCNRKSKNRCDSENTSNTAISLRFQGKIWQSKPFSGHFALFSLVFPAIFKEKRARYAEKGLDYQILPFSAGKACDFEIVIGNR